MTDDESALDEGGLDRPAETSEHGLSLEAERSANLTPREAIAGMRIRVPVRGNRTLREVVARANADPHLRALWHVANVNAVRRMQINDHSWVHIQIVTNLGLKLLRDLVRAGVEPGAVKDYGMTREDAEVIVALGCLLHCTGMAIHRHGHEDWSLFLAADMLPRLLEGLYEEPELSVISAEVLQTITAHRSDGEPLSLEAGVVRVADALDMTKGRSRTVFEAGRVSMHSLSAAAVEAVQIVPGTSRLLLIEIEMNNSAGVFQVDEVLRPKLEGSGLEPYLEVVARIEGDAEKRLVPIFRL